MNMVGETNMEKAPCAKFENLTSRTNFSFTKSLLAILFILNVIMLMRDMLLKKQIKRYEYQNHIRSKRNHKKAKINNAVSDISKYAKEIQWWLQTKKKHFPYLIKEPKKCQDEQGKEHPSVFLILAIKSRSAENFRRTAIRKTWGNESLIEGIIIKRLFLLATDKDKNYQKLVELESEVYGDIIQGNFQDSFQNLTFKNIMFLRWMTRYCPQAKYIFQGDDDVLVNIYNVVEYILSLSPNQSKNLFAGSVLSVSQRITDPRRKYFVPKILFAKKYYPPYVSGGGFVMSSLVAKKILHITKSIPLIPIDDAFLGICLKKLRITPLNHRGFKSWGLRNKKKTSVEDICMYKSIMTYHKVKDMELAWQQLLESRISDLNCTKIYLVDNFFQNVNQTSEK